MSNVPLIPVDKGKKQQLSSRKGHAMEWIGNLFKSTCLDGQASPAFSPIEELPADVKLSQFWHIFADCHIQHWWMDCYSRVFLWTGQASPAFSSIEELPADVARVALGE